MIFNFIIEDPEKSLFTEKLSQTHYTLARFQYNNKGMPLSINPTYDLQNTPPVVHESHSNQVAGLSIF